MQSPKFLNQPNLSQESAWSYLKRVLTRALVKVAPIEKLHREAACDHPCQLTCSNCARSFSFGGCFREGGGRAANQRARPMVGRQCKPPQTRGALEFKLYVRTATISLLLPASFHLTWGRSPARWRASVKRVQIGERHCQSILLCCPYIP